MPWPKKPSAASVDTAVQDSGVDAAAVERVMLRDFQRLGESVLEFARVAAPPLDMTDNEFAERYLRHTPLFPESGPSRWFAPPPMHGELSAAADSHSRLLIQVAREHAKSSRFSLIRPLRIICCGLRDPKTGGFRILPRDVRIVIVSKTAQAAEKFTAAIKFQLANNERIIAEFGRFAPDKRVQRERDFPWGDGVFTVSRAAEYKEPTVQAVGRGGQIVSGRYDIVVVDDGEDYESTRTQAARLKTHQWFLNDVVPVVTPQGSIWVIQTPQHESDLVGQMRKNALWVAINRSAERELSDGEDGQPPADGSAPADRRIGRASAWSEKWPIYYTHCDVRRAELRGASEGAMATAAVGANGACLRCPVYNPSLGNTNGVGCLTGKRFEVGTIYYRLQYNCDISALGGDVFRREWFRYYVREQVVYDRRRRAWYYTDPGTQKRFRLEVYAGIDPAISEENEQAPDDEHSKFAIVVIGYARELRRRLILAFVNTRVDFPTQVKITGEIWTAWSPRQIAVEEIYYQRALRQQIVKELRLPLKAGIKSVPDKFAKFSSLTPEVEAGNVYVLAEHEELVSQASQFPRGAHTDLLDAWWVAEQIVGRPRMLEGFAKTGGKRYEGSMEEAEDPGHRDRLAQAGWRSADVLREG